MEDLLPYIDLVVIGAALALVMTYLFTIGKGRAVSLLVSTYIAVFTVRTVPDIFFVAEKVDLFKQDLQSVVVIVLLVIIVQLLLLRNGFFDPYIETERAETIAYGVASTGLLLYASSYVLMPSTLEMLSPWVKTAFFEEPFIYIWPLLPIAVILIIRGK